MELGSCPISERTLALKAEDLIGTWRLRSWKNVASDGSAVDPLGENPVGYIFYNHDGYMSVEITAAHRIPYREPDAFGGTPEERSEAISTYLSLFRTLRGAAEPGHRDPPHRGLLVSELDRQRAGAVREARGDLLTLSTKPMTFHGVDRTAELVWERLGHD
jgi:hypothetical protein